METEGGCKYYVLSPFAPSSLTGQAVLVNRGTCSFYWKARFAQEAGAAAVIIANNTGGQLAPSVDTAGGSAFIPIPCPSADFPTCPAVAIPTVAILQADGNTIRTRLASGTVDLTWTDEKVSTVNPNGGLISSFQFVWPFPGPGPETGHRGARRLHLVLVSA